MCCITADSNRHANRLYTQRNTREWSLKHKQLSMHVCRSCAFHAVVFVTLFNSFWVETTFTIPQEYERQGQIKSNCIKFGQFGFVKINKKNLDPFWRYGKYLRMKFLELVINFFKHFNVAKRWNFARFDP